MKWWHVLFMFGWHEPCLDRLRVHPEGTSYPEGVILLRRGRYDVAVAKFILFFYKELFALILVDLLEVKTIMQCAGQCKRKWLKPLLKSYVL